jgi:hypothetical protein
MSHGICHFHAVEGKTYFITIYIPMIYTARCIMFWMRAYPLREEVGGDWALEFSSFLGPV